MGGGGIPFPWAVTWGKGGGGGRKPYILYIYIVYTHAAGASWAYVCPLLYSGLPIAGKLKTLRFGFYKISTFSQPEKIS